MNAKDPNRDDRHLRPGTSDDSAENVDATSSGESGTEATREGSPSNVPLPETSQEATAQSSPSGEQARFQEAEALASDRDEESAPAAESPGDDEVFEDADAGVSSAQPAESTPPAADSSDPVFPFTEIHGRTTLGRPFFGSLSQLSELPDSLIENLDAESAANLKAAMENPETGPPPVFDAETIRDLQASFPSSTGTAADFEKPWYHGELPPLRLEVVLLRYDAIVGETIHRASRLINRTVEDYSGSNKEDILFRVQSMLRDLYR